MDKSLDTAKYPLITACLIVKNEAHYLERCLKSIVEIADEIIIVDTGSTDQTQQIARTYTSKVFSYPWEDHFGEARNFALKQATGQVILSIDADEVLVSGMAEKIRAYLAQPEFLEQPFVLNFRVTSEEHEDLYTRTLFSNRPEIHWTGRVHEFLQSTDGPLQSYNCHELLLWHQSSKADQGNKQKYYHDLLEQNLSEALSLEHVNHLQKHLGLSYLTQKNWRAAWNTLSHCYVGMHDLGIQPQDGFYGEVLKGLVKAGSKLHLSEARIYVSELVFHYPLEPIAQFGFKDSHSTKFWQKGLAAISMSIIAACQPTATMSPANQPHQPEKGAILLKDSTKDNSASGKTLIPDNPNPQLGDFRITAAFCPPSHARVNACYAAQGFPNIGSNSLDEEGYFCYNYGGCCRSEPRTGNQVCYGPNEPVPGPDEVGMEICSNDLVIGGKYKGCFSCPSGQEIEFKNSQPTGCRPIDETETEKNYFSTQSAVDKPSYQRINNDDCELSPS
jgi:hypothetical protein